MEQERLVFLWVGNVQSSEELDRLLAVSYSDEGDFIPSIFAKHFEIDRYDDEIIPRFTNLVQEGLTDDFNAVVLLYNFKYTGEIIEVNVRSNYFRFLGAVEYQ